MAGFTDAERREWSLLIDIPTAREIRKTLDVDILDVDQGLTKLATNPILFCDVLYMICRDQAEQKKIDDVEFGKSLRGDVLEHASDAFLEALMDFCPPRRREVLKTLQQTTKTLEQALTGAAGQKREEMEKLLASIGGNSSPAGRDSSATNSPDPSES